MHIALAPFRLKDGVTEQALVAASDGFERDFVRRQEGILQRFLVKDGKGGFADVVFFSDKEAMTRVVEAEQNSEACAAFFSIMSADDSHSVFEVIKAYG
ncbi:hypothetical protein ACIP9X_03255 [Arthrobacter sp. NPDC093125]|uniref:hypothetical protein n=1 Tax=Arthrobacter sp. NPDC093125 TaxID=3363944 RepID=UPI00381B7B0D